MHSKQVLPTVTKNGKLITCLLTRFICGSHINSVRDFRNLAHNISIAYIPFKSIMMIHAPYVMFHFLIDPNHSVPADAPNVSWVATVLILTFDMLLLSP